MRADATQYSYRMYLLERLKHRWAIDVKLGLDVEEDSERDPVEEWRHMSTSFLELAFARLYRGVLQVHLNDLSVVFL